MKKQEFRAGLRRAGRTLLAALVVSAVAVTALPAWGGGSALQASAAETGSSAQGSGGQSSAAGSSGSASASQSAAAKAEHDNQVEVGGAYAAGDYRGVPEGKTIRMVTAKQAQKLKHVKLVKPAAKNGQLPSSKTASSSASSNAKKDNIWDDILQDLFGGGSSSGNSGFSSSSSSSSSSSVSYANAQDNGTSKYYYSKMTKEEKQLYNALLTCAADPYQQQRVVYTTNNSRTSSGFTDDEIQFTFYGLCYDHPELYWLWMAGNITFDPVRQGVEESSGSSSTSLGNTGNGKYNWYVWLDYNPSYDSGMHHYAGDETGYFYTRTQLERMNRRLDRAADQFLEDIDMDQPQAVIALEIHDKYLREVQYDNAAANETASYYDRAHTAYGALVDHSAVCDGYSLGLKYLLSRSGIEAVMVPGLVGTGTSTSSYGGHAWNMLKLDDTWYETDSTWDDDPEGDDHTYYDLTTAKMTTMKDRVLGRTVHHYRDETLMHESNDIFYHGEAFGTGVKKALPTAKSTHFKYSYVKQHGKTLDSGTDSLGRKVTLATRISGSYAPLSSSGNTESWNVRTCYTKKGKLRLNNSIWKEQISVPSGSALTVTEGYTPDSGIFTLGRSGENGGSRKVTAKVTYDNGTVSTVTGTLDVAADATLQPSSYIYNGSVQQPKVTVTSWGTPLAESDRTISLADADSKIGRYAAEVTYNGFLQYKDPEVLYYDIRPEAPSLQKLQAAAKTGKSSKRQIRVSWKKMQTASGASGYEIQYSTSKDFPAGKTSTKKVASISRSSLTLKNLKPGTRYYVRIRSYANGQIHGAGASSSSPGMKKDGSTVRLRSGWSKVLARTAKA